MFTVKLMLVLLGTVLAGSSVALASPVKLVEAEIVQGCSSCGLFKGTILVENFAYAKHISVAYQLGSGAWASFPARFRNLVEGTNQEVWEFDDISTDWLFNPVHFAIRYDVDGQTYWDNNCGLDYYLNMTAPNGRDDVSEVSGRSCQ